MPPLFRRHIVERFPYGRDRAGLAMKLCNNMITQVTKVVVAEAMALGTKAGVEMYDVISVSTGNSEVSARRCPGISAATSRAAR